MARMTEAKLRKVFGDFRPLNLMVLIEDLRRGLVARGDWHDVVDKTVCPVAHNWGSGSLAVGCMYKLANVVEADADVFIGWWDGDCSVVESPSACRRRTKMLLRVLEKIQAERLGEAIGAESTAKVVKKMQFKPRKKRNLAVACS